MCCVWVRHRHPTPLRVLLPERPFIFIFHIVDPLIIDVDLRGKARNLGFLTVRFRAVTIKRLHLRNLIDVSSTLQTSPEPSPVSVPVLSRVEMNIDGVAPHVTSPQNKRFYERRGRLFEY